MLQTYFSSLMRMFERDRQRHARLWPRPEHSLADEPHFLFILTPPYSGSTALAQVLNTCPGTAFLQSRAEGQWLIPGMCTADRWDAGKYIDWESVRSVWLHRVQFVRELVQDVDLVIEKSPPNLVRTGKLIETFPNHTLLAFNRNPFAYCSSLVYRDYQPVSMTPDERVDTFRRVAEGWLTRSIWIRKWIDELDIVHFTYEEFCRNPASCVARISRQAPVFQGVNVDKPIKVKDYRVQRIENQNVRQLARLKPEEISCIADVLRTNVDIVEYFGYKAGAP